MEKIKCIFCNKENGKVIIEENGFKGLKCADCGLIYISPRPTLKEIINLYGHDGAGVTAEAQIGSEMSKRLFARHNLKIIKKHIEKGRMLEIGSGAGYFLDEARKKGFEPYGIEFNPLQVKFMRENLNIPTEDSALDDKIFKGIEFDAVYHCDVISHFFNPIDEFKKINGRMKKGGYLVFETGNLGETKEKYFRYYTRFQYPDHLFFFNTGNIKTLLEKTGFEFIRIYRYSIMPQLAVKKAFVFLRKPKGGHAAGGSAPKRKASVSVPVFKKKSFPKNVINSLINHLNYFTRYKLGAVLPKKGRPQTVIIVARKK